MLRKSPIVMAVTVLGIDAMFSFRDPNGVYVDSIGPS
jgi:hypothetical protein